VTGSGSSAASYRSFDEGLRPAEHELAQDDLRRCSSWNDATPHARSVRGTLLKKRDCRGQVAEWSSTSLRLHHVDSACAGHGNEGQPPRRHSGHATDTLPAVGGGNSRKHRCTTSYWHAAENDLHYDQPSQPNGRLTCGNTSGAEGTRTPDPHTASSTEAYPHQSGGVRIRRSAPMSDLSGHSCTGLDGASWQPRWHHGGRDGSTRCRLHRGRCRALASVRSGVRRPAAAVGCL
jgi:hypothetical protein